MLDGALGWLSRMVRDTLNAVWALLAATVFHLPDVTRLPQVVALSGRALVVVDAAFVLVIMLTGLVVMSAGWQSRYGAGELVPRLVLAFAAANFATTICQVIISGTNTLVQALTGAGIASNDSLKQLLRIILAQLSGPVSALLGAVLGLILVVLVLMLVVGWIARVFLLVLLCGIAPLALALHATPWSDPLARLWWKSMGAVVAVVVLQAVLLNTSLAILLDPAANVPLFGAHSDSSGVFNLLVIICLLWLVVRIPALVRRQVSGGGGGGRANIIGAAVRLSAMQQLTRALPGPGRLLRGPWPLGPSGFSSGPGGSGPRGGGPRGSGPPAPMAPRGAGRPPAPPRPYRWRSLTPAGAMPARTTSQPGARIATGAGRSGASPAAPRSSNPGSAPISTAPSNFSVRAQRRGTGTTGASAPPTSPSTTPRPPAGAPGPVSPRPVNSPHPQSSRTARPPRTP